MATIDIGFQSFDIINDGSVLPTQKGWCKQYSRESSKVIAKIRLHGKPAYALKCEKCGSMHHMYESMFRTRYIGSDLPNNGGHINPTKGIETVNNSMDRRAKESIRQIPKTVEDHMCEMFGYTHEEYREKKRLWDEADSLRRKKYKNMESERRAKFVDENIQKESDNRRELIEKGVLKYVKGVGLVNTETGKVVKL